MSLTRKIMFAGAVAAAMFVLAPPHAEAQSVRTRASGEVAGQRFSAGARYSSRPQYRTYDRTYEPRYIVPGNYGPYRGPYYRPYGRSYYPTSRYYGDDGSVRLRF